MEKATHEIDQAVSAEAVEWAKRFLEERRAVILRRKIDTTGKLVQSLDFEIENSPVDAAVKLLVAFESYGRMVEMKGITYDKWGRDPIERLKGWVTKKGLQNFESGFIEKYKLKSAPSDMLNRIAWGIMKSRKAGKYRRRLWYAAAKSASISNDLYNHIAAAISDPAIKAVSNDLKKYARAKGR